jgi:hypothetical protein
MLIRLILGSYIHSSLISHIYLNLATIYASKAWGRWWLSGLQASPWRWLLVAAVVLQSFCMAPFCACSSAWQPFGGVDIGSLAALAGGGSSLAAYCYLSAYICACNGSDFDFVAGVVRMLDLLKYSLAYRYVGGFCRGVLLGCETSIHDAAWVDYGALGSWCCLFSAWASVQQIRPCSTYMEDIF